MMFADYKVGLVMTRSGLNEQQVVFLKHHLRTIARTVDTRVTLVVPIVALRDPGEHHPERQRVRTESLVAPLRLRADAEAWLTIEILGTQDVRLLTPQLAELDEVWCATSGGSSGNEHGMRPSVVFRRAQHLREAPRFKMLHYWVELDPELLPTQETRKGKKNRPALKGY